MPKNIVNIYHFGQKVQTWIIGLNHTNQTLLIKIHNRANFKSVPVDLMQRLVPEQRPPALPGPPGQPAAAVPRAGPAPCAPAPPVSSRRPTSRFSISHAAISTSSCFTFKSLVIIFTNLPLKLEAKACVLLAQGYGVE